MVIPGGVLTQTTQPVLDWGAHCVVSPRLFPMEAQGDVLGALWGVRVTGPLGPHCVVLGSETVCALCWQSRGFVREQASVDSCQLCTAAFLCALWCETGCAGLGYTGLELWSVRSRVWWERMNQTRPMIWMFTVCGDLYNCVRGRSDWCSMKHKTICLGGQALSERTFVSV